MQAWQLLSCKLAGLTSGAELDAQHGSWKHNGTQWTNLTHDCNCVLQLLLEDSPLATVAVPSSKGTGQAGMQPVVHSSQHSFCPVLALPAVPAPRMEAQRQLLPLIVLSSHPLVVLSDGVAPAKTAQSAALHTAHAASAISNWTMLSSAQACSACEPSQDKSWAVQ